MHLYQLEVVCDCYERLPTAVVESHTCLPDLLSKEIYSFLETLTKDDVKETAEACLALRLFSPAAHSYGHQ